MNRKYRFVDDYEQKLQEDKEVRKAMEEQKRELGRVFDETQRQLEEDIDQEIEDLRKNNENKLSAEREATCASRVKNGIMKKSLAHLRRILRFNVKI